ncbi:MULTISPECIES: DedA family protein [unclassified Pseudomonas]|uniref:DedA family protein n=1 Tax=unclassified Pseudomonas TaxID=196821 RepID=UPI002AC9D25A|nr:MULTISPECIES: DedA family protein [unclassified Pseudomonas]MEB0043474.1 DedA family protein [Pseudomonas sp. MH10]MEB0079138.1 DedA family protein [Pseudomonas sp. MH10out]MEB0092418.1 DedA family protein [Pseudomonas sp. CCI4.2]MEB0102083.1 DedA family protein [Pseudomonas sp. CCI3.2]MEB0122067.1 DedA family protein [Pseudomonas sp. CCI1.2]
MTLTQVIAEYGYLAVFIGAALEGETVLIIAGFAAHEGYLSFPLLALVAVFGGALSDCVFFTIGRRYGSRLMARFPKLQPSARRVNLLLERYQTGLIIGVRFMYGLRIAGPIAIGMSDVPTSRFVLFNLIGAAIWAPLIAGVGYLFGQSLEWLFADIKHYEEDALLAIIVVALMLAVLRFIRRRLKTSLH